MLTEASHITLADDLPQTLAIAAVTQQLIAVCRSAVPKLLELDISNSVQVLAKKV